MSPFLPVLPPPPPPPREVTVWNVEFPPFEPFAITAPEPEKPFDPPAPTVIV